MQNIYSYVLPPHIALDDISLEAFLRESLKIKEGKSLFFRKLKQSIDARKKDVKINLEIEVSLEEPFENATFNVYQYHKKSFSKTILIVGSGPAGLFAAFRCL